MPLKNCKWIGTKSDCVSPIISRSFYAAAGRKASLYITGLGYFEAKINGNSITDWLLLPVVSDYEPRDFTKLLYPLGDTTTNRLYYYQFDVSPFIKEGKKDMSL